MYFSLSLRPQDPRCLDTQASVGFAASNDAINLFPPHHSVSGPSKKVLPTSGVTLKNKVFLDRIVTFRLRPASNDSGIASDPKSSHVSRDIYLSDLKPEHPGHNRDGPQLNIGRFLGIWSRLPPTVPVHVSSVSTGTQANIPPRLGAILQYLSRVHRSTCQQAPSPKPDPTASQTTHLVYSCKIS